MAMSNYALFSVMGLEIEYMLVDKTTLEVQPKSDLILQQLAGSQVNEVALGDIAISNELVMHVLELKNNGPKPAQSPLVDHFQTAILHLQKLLEAHHLQLLPTGAHPWMDPLTQTKRWPYGNKAIYQQYDAIFNCQGHGWANLQSMHINLPFTNDEEFSRLHSAIRLLLPLLPALGASTPILDGKPTGLLDSRLDFYAKNQQRIPSITGDVIPEWVRSKADYEKTILKPMYRDISAFDTQGILQFEWLNSRGAIAKFDSNAIEIRILDTQECVKADIAIAQATHAILKRWYQHTSLIEEEACTTPPLKALFDQTIRHGLQTRIEDSIVLSAMGLPTRTMTVRDAWSLLIEQVSPELEPPYQETLELILRHGNLSERILRACKDKYSKTNMSAVYRQLAECLLHNQLFI